MKDQLPETYRHPLSNDLYYDMVLVKAGSFIMGSNEENAYDEEKPEHLVRLTEDFYIGVYPVTQAVWKAVMGHNPSSYQGDQRPVEEVSWQDIMEGGQDASVPSSFVSQLQQKFPLKDGIPKDFQFRLPTEAEWEYAAKGGHKTKLNDLDAQHKAIDLYTSYSGSDSIKEVGWYTLNSHRETKEVGRKKPNELGLFDMTGNVWEWCLDWYDSDFYQRSSHNAATNPTGAEPGHFRVVRGGSWSNSARNCRVSCRYVDRPSYRYGNVGFRLVLSPSSAGRRKRAT